MSTEELQFELSTRPGTNMYLVIKVIKTFDFDIQGRS